jgi:hypothetical protein
MMYVTLQARPAMQLAEQEDDVHEEYCSPIFRDNLNSACRVPLVGGQGRAPDPL